MTRKQLRESVERYLQDSKNDRWKDDEINAYIDEAQMEFCRLAKIVAADVTSTLVTVGTRASAALIVSGRTISVVKESGTHTLAIGDSVLISDTTDNYRKGGHLVIAVSANSSFTGTPATADTITYDATAAGFSVAVGDKVVFTTTGTIPTGLSASTVYYVLAIGGSGTSSTFTVSATSGGDVIDITNVGSGTLTVGVATFDYLLPENITQTGGEAITFVETGPVYTKDSTILEVTSVTLDGRELAAYTQSDLDSASSKYKNSSIYVRTALGSTPSPFSSLDAGSPTRWRDSHGKIEGFVMSQRSATTFRVFPLPSEEEHVYLDKDATTKVSQTLRVQGVLNPIALASDTSTPQIPESYHESLVYGALDRAYLKESQMRNMDKAQVFRVKFLEIAAEARMQEGLNSGSLARGRNQISMRVWR